MTVACHWVILIVPTIPSLCSFHSLLLFLLHTLKLLYSHIKALRRHIYNPAPDLSRFYTISEFFSFSASASLTSFSASRQHSNIIFIASYLSFTFPHPSALSFYIQTLENKLTYFFLFPHGASHNYLPISSLHSALHPHPHD